MQFAAAADIHDGALRFGLYWLIDGFGDQAAIAELAIEGHPAVEAARQARTHRLIRPPVAMPVGHTSEHFEGFCAELGFVFAFLRKKQGRCK